MQRVQRGCGAEKQQYFESMSVRKVIFLGALRQIPGEERDDRCSQNGEVRKKVNGFQGLNNTVPEVC